MKLTRKSSTPLASSPMVRPSRSALPVYWAGWQRISGKVMLQDAARAWSPSLRVRLSPRPRSRKPPKGAPSTIASESEKRVRTTLAVSELQPARQIEPARELHSIRAVSALALYDALVLGD